MPLPGPSAPHAAWHRRLAGWIAPASLALPLCLCVYACECAWVSVDAAELPPIDPPADAVSDPVGQMVFLAVIAGCYRDGLTTEDVDIILPKNPDTGGARLEEHFVYGCPLCMPVVEALRLYQGRRRFLGDEHGRSTFGTGLDADTAKRLRSPTRAVRIAVIQSLISAWVAHRLELQHLSVEERAAWSMAIDQRRKRGETLLKGLKSGERGADYVDLYGAWTTHCPVCDAVVTGAGVHPAASR